MAEFTLSSNTIPNTVLNNSAIRVDASSGNQTITLPRVHATRDDSVREGFLINIIKTDNTNNTVTINQNSNNTAFNSPLIINRTGGVELRANSNHWNILGSVLGGLDNSIFVGQIMFSQNAITSPSDRRVWKTGCFIDPNAPRTNKFILTNGELIVSIPPTSRWKFNPASVEVSYSTMFDTFPESLRATDGWGIDAQPPRVFDAIIRRFEGVGDGAIPSQDGTLRYFTNLGLSIDNEILLGSQVQWVRSSDGRVYEIGSFQSGRSSGSSVGSFNPTAQWISAHPDNM